MPKTLRRESYIRGITNLVNEITFKAAFLGVVLSLFFFSPERMISVRVSILSASCILLLVSANTFTKRKKRTVRLPLLALSAGGALFAVWGLGIVARALLSSAGDGPAIATGAWFVLFGVVTLATALRARV